MRSHLTGRKAGGFSIVEMMIGTLIGMLLSLALMLIYFAQTRMYNTANTQGQIQSLENAITFLLTPPIRSAGFVGCGSINTALSNLNAGGPPPLGILNTTPAMVYGYDGGHNSIVMTQDNPSNSSSLSNWTPALDSSFQNLVQANNDVVVVVGAPVESFPVGVTQITSGSSSFTVQTTTGFNLSSGQYGAISDCVKTSVFQITGVAGTTIDHAAGSGSLANASDSFLINFSKGAQFIPVQQTAFFVGHGTAGVSTLMRGVLNGSTWTVEPLVPGVELMKVQYGIGSNGIPTQYVDATAVTDWTQVYSIRLGFILEGDLGSGAPGGTNPTQFQIFNIPVTVPADNRLRHTFEITINLRNALS